MKALSVFQSLYAALIAFLCISSSVCQEDPAVALTITNQLPEDVSVYWEGKEQRVYQGMVPGLGGELILNTDTGHLFTYDYAGERHWITFPVEEAIKVDGITHVSHVMNGGKDEIDVFCTVTIKGGTFKGIPLRMIIRPSWAPRGASRFLQLVRLKYFDGMAINRVVPNFLVQFGIGKNVRQRHAFSELQFMDDPKVDMKFQPGMISFAGNGPNTRSTEVFIAMPGVSDAQLEYWGEKPWETPIGYVAGRLEDTPLTYFSSYGDIPPDGNGPHPHEIYKNDGYEYLAENFPDLDYIEKCFLPWEAMASSSEL